MAASTVAAPAPKKTRPKVPAHSAIQRRAGGRQAGGRDRWTREEAAIGRAFRRVGGRLRAELGEVSEWVAYLEGWDGASRDRLTRSKRAFVPAS